jgi:hypothetical protein
VYPQFEKKCLSKIKNLYHPKDERFSRGTTLIGKKPAQGEALTDNGVPGSAYFRSSGHSSEVIFWYPYLQARTKPCSLKGRSTVLVLFIAFPFFTRKESGCQ